MIHTNRVVTVGENESIIDRPIVLYRGDREVEIEFELVGNEFMFSKEGNVIKTTNASHGQLVLNTPSGENMFSELAECHDGKVAFIVTKEMIDEFIEVGFYSFQIRLYDSAEQKSRVTLPPILNGFDIRNPIAAEDETNVVDQGLVDYARVFKDQSNEELPTFDWTGAYNKTEWAHHDVITENKMNKIEDALYSINANIKESDVVMLNALDQVTKDADAYIKEHMAEVEAEVEEFERNLNTGVEQFKIDTNAAMTAHKNEVSEELESVNSQLAHIAKTPEQFGAVGNGEADDTLSIQEAINSLSDNEILEFRGKYKITSQININKPNIRLTGRGTIILGGNNFNIFYITSDYVTIELLSFSNPYNYIPDNTVDTKCIAIYINSNNCIVSKCKIDNFAVGIRYGVSGVLRNGCLITDNNITNVLGVNTGFVNEGIVAIQGKAIITNNVIECKKNTISRSCIVVDLEGDNSIVSNNICNCNNSGGVGIHVESSPYTTISNNKIFLPKRQGMTTSDYCIIDSNYIETPNSVDSDYHLTHSGIFASGSTSLTITNNIINGNLSNAVGIYFSGGSFHNVHGNKFIGRANNLDIGIRLHIANNSLISNNTFSENLCNSSITLSGANNSIVNNNIKGGKVCINVNGNNTLISNNTLINSDNAIKVYNADNIRIESNDLSDYKDVKTQAYSVSVNQVGGHKFVYIYDNKMEGNLIKEVEYGSFSNNVYVRDNKSIMLQTESGKRYKIYIDDDGTLKTSTTV